MARVSACTALAAASLPLPARADPRPATLLPTVTPLTDCAACPAPHRPDPESEARLASLARELDAVLIGAAQDLGFSVEVSSRPQGDAGPVSELDLVERAKEGWVFSPRLVQDGQRATVRIVAAEPGSAVLLVRTETLRPADLEVRTVLMMRDLVSRRVGAGAAGPDAGGDAERPSVVSRARSHGRAVLAMNAAILGGYVGYSLQRAGGSTDARLTYPLMALGTGVGIGASMIVAEEWDVGVGDAWYLSAGTWWPLTGTLLFAGGTGTAAREKYIYGAGAAAGGLALATTSLSFGGMGEGGALIAQSGGAFGVVLGGIADLAVVGRADTTPTRGMGLGAIFGVVAGGTLARFVPDAPASRVLLVDLSAGLGALTGAAVASPLVFGDDVTATRNRLWLSSIALGTFLGGGAGLLVFGDWESQPKAKQAFRAEPFAGVIGESPGRRGSSVPVTGVGVRGVF